MSSFISSDLGNNAREKYKTFSYDYSYWSTNDADSHFSSQDQVSLYSVKRIVES
jgi:hypothetical protein